MDLFHILIGIGLFLLTILSNVFIYKSIVKRAIRKKIIPYLSSLGCEFIGLKYRGFFYNGNFKPKSSSLIMNPNGKSRQSIYQELIFKNKEEKIVSVTVRIDNEFMFLTNVYYCPEIKSII